TIAVSTLISAFNSLTLSPALTALLLRPRHQPGARGGDKETRRGGEGETSRLEPLPRLAFPLVGALLAWQAPALPFSLSPPLPLSLAPYLLMLAGAVIGWLVSRPLNWLLGTAFRAFNVGFNRATAGYVGLVGGLLRVSVLILVIYGGLLALTYFGFAYAPKG